MKTCTCGGKLYRHMAVPSKSGMPAGFRFKCSVCGKSITVRAGEICAQRGRPMKEDWRHEMGASQ